MLICIDAGHGRYTPGKRCMKSLDPNETREWALNSRVADKLQQLLAGYDCKTMRVDDVTGEKDVPLSERCSKANSAKADLYLSIHHNAGIKGGKGGGIVVFTSTRCSQKSKEVQSAAYRHLIRQTGLAGNRAQPMVSQDLYVLRNTKMPAILCECGFMDSAHDTPIILTDTFAQRAAQGLCDAIVELYGLRHKGGINIDVDWGPIMPDLWAKAIAMGITDGSRPRDLASREEVAVMILNAIQAKGD